MSLKFIILITLLVFIDHSIASGRNSNYSSIKSKRRSRDKGKAPLREVESAQPMVYFGKEEQLTPAGGIGSYKKWPCSFSVHTKEKDIYQPGVQNFLNQMETAELTSNLEPKINYTLEQIDPFRYSASGKNQHIHDPQGRMNELREYAASQKDQQLVAEGMRNLRVSTRPSYPGSTSRHTLDPREAQTARFTRRRYNDVQNDPYGDSDLADLVRSGMSKSRKND